MEEEFSPPSSTSPPTTPTTPTTPIIVSGHTHIHGVKVLDFHRNMESADLEEPSGNGHVVAWGHDNTLDLQQGEGQGEGPEVLLEQQTQKTQCKEAKQVMGNEWYAIYGMQVIA